MHIANVPCRLHPIEFKFWRSGGYFGCSHFYHGHRGYSLASPTQLLPTHSCGKLVRFDNWVVLPYDAIEVLWRMARKDPKAMLCTNGNKLLILLFASLICIGICASILGWVNQGSPPEAAITVLLPEAAVLGRSMMRYYLEKAKEWVEEYQETRDKQVLVVSVPYDDAGVWYDQKLLAMIVAGSEPDVIFVQYDKLLDLAAIGKLKNLDSLGLECSTRMPVPDDHSNESAPVQSCIGLPHHALPNYYFSILSTTHDSQAASELLLFLSDQGADRSLPR